MSIPMRERSRWLWWRVIGMSGRDWALIVGLLVVVLALGSHYAEVSPQRLFGKVSNSTPDLDATCTSSPVACSLATGVAGSAMTALLVTAIWLNWYGGRRALRRTRRVLDDRLRAALPYEPGRRRPSGADRQAVLSEVVSELLRGYPDPVLVTGESGAGKSTFLLQVALGLTRQRRFGVTLDLAGHVAGNDVEALVRSRFLEMTDDFLLSADHGDRLWRRFSRRRRIVILADGLDEADLPGDELGRRAALARLFSDLSAIAPTIVASRPNAVSAAVAAIRFELPPLSEEILAVSILKRATRSTAPADVVAALKALDAGRVPFFSHVLGDIVEREQSVPLLEPVMSSARQSVLQRYLAPLTTSDLGVLSATALTRVLDGRTARRDPLLEPDPALVGAPLSLRIIVPTPGTRQQSFRFFHPILEVYCASISISPGWIPPGPKVDSLPATSEVADAIVWSYMRDRDSAWVRRLFDDLDESPFQRHHSCADA